MGAAFGSGADWGRAEPAVKTSRNIPAKHPHPQIFLPGRVLLLECMTFPCPNEQLAYHADRRGLARKTVKHGPCVNLQLKETNTLNSQAAEQGV